MRGLGQFDARGDCGGVLRRRGKVHVQRFGRVEFGDRQRPDQVVEVTPIALANGLEIFDPVKHNLRVENGSDVSGFFERVGSRPVGLFINDGFVILNPACAQPRSRG